MPCDNTLYPPYLPHPTTMREGRHFKPTRPRSFSGWRESSKRYVSKFGGFFLSLDCTHLSQINTFYLQKEAELKLRLETLLSKRKAAASRFLPDGVDDTLAAKDHVEWKAVEEGFRLLERDLSKLQVTLSPLIIPMSFQLCIFGSSNLWKLTP